ncbi:hypothetical protein AAG747_14220 [Rapidithrix thailandica]|uniref:Uncharacterized protein n=1 Tax=Rapidithrix thailandica TaxID=413964 RepID=A0AAW9RW95_9BACT
MYLVAQANPNLSGNPTGYTPVITYRSATPQVTERSYLLRIGTQNELIYSGHISLHSNQSNANTGLQSGNYVDMRAMQQDKRFCLEEVSHLDYDQQLINRQPADKVLPVLLQPNWLLAMGFEMSGANIYHKHGFCLTQSGESFTTRIASRYTRVDFVHNLQNLYRLATLRSLKTGL